MKENNGDGKETDNRKDLMSNGYSDSLFPFPSFICFYNFKKKLKIINEHKNLPAFQAYIPKNPSHYFFLMNEIVIQ